MATTEALIKAIAVTAELTNTQLSAPAARVMADDLARYPEHQVIEALTRCRRELKGRLTIADVLTRIDDGRPGAEEAWAMIPKAESATIVWTDEMAQAFGVCAGLLETDEIAARMAFKESYSDAIRKARDAGKPARWSVTPGTDPHGREASLLAAVKLGRITAEYATRLLPYRGEVSPQLKALLDMPSEPKTISGPQDKAA